MIRRIKAAFEILKAPSFRTSVVTAKGDYKRGPNLWQEHHHKAKDAQQFTKKKGGRKFTSIWDRWQNDENYRESQLAIDWSDAWVRYLDHLHKIDISHKAPQEQRSRYNNLLYLRCVHEDRQAPLLSQRPGYQAAKNAQVEMQTQSRQYLGIPFYQKSGYLGWLSTNRALSASQKNANRQPHLPLLIGLQHPGGAHTRGLRTGKDGINTVGRMTNGTSSLRKLVTRLQNDVIDKNQKT